MNALNYQSRLENSFILRTDCMKDLGVYIDCKRHFHRSVDFLFSHAMKILALILTLTCSFLPCTVYWCCILLWPDLNWSMLLLPGTLLHLLTPEDLGARGSVVGWGTMLQAGRSPVQVPDEVDFFNLPNPSSRTMAVVSTRPLTELSTRHFPGGKKRPARRADNLAAVCVPNVWKFGSLNLSQP
jgi:hypothetical protein